MPFFYLDIDNPANDSVKQQLGFRYQPQFILLDGDGNIIQQWVGLPNPDDIRAALDAALAATGDAGSAENR